MTDLCGCGCGESVWPGRRYVVDHYARTLRGPELPDPVPCACGCGEMARPGKQYVYQHHTRRGRRKRVGAPSCPQCGRTVNVRLDGTVGAHYVSKGKVGERYRCPGGAPSPVVRRPRRGRRVTVAVDVVLPEGWDALRLRAEATQVLRLHLDEPHVFGVSVLDDEAAS